MQYCTDPFFVFNESYFVFRWVQIAMWIYTLSNARRKMDGHTYVTYKTGRIEFVLRKGV